jgi:hydroxymethylpyrimidine/phosphomethylpyrimidine kinase
MDKVLTIAGFDPSAGAGLLADIKTFEAFGVYGFGVCTAVTVQNESSFESPGWLTVDHIIDQLDCLYRAHHIEVIKIGLVEDFYSLSRIVSAIKRNAPEVKIIWDPILKSSTGFSIHNEGLRDEIGEILPELFLITPNAIEATMLGLENGSEHTSILVKGGHKTGEESEDLLFLNKDRVLSFTTARIPNTQKHGSGCVFSSAIAALLAKGNSLPEACSVAKEYITEFLVSTDTLLGVNKNLYEKA